MMHFTIHLHGHEVPVRSDGLLSAIRLAVAADALSGCEPNARRFAESVYRCRARYVETLASDGLVGVA